MALLFVYGTLKKVSTHKKILGRRVNGFSDILENYSRSKIKINNHSYPIITKKRGRSIRGFVFTVNLEELALIDEYETKAYRRQGVVLKSGKSAWVYMK